MFDCRFPINGSPALCSKEGIVSYQELDRKVDETALLLTRFGIKSHDLIAALLPPSPSLIFLLFAAFRIGASISLLNTKLPPLQIQAQLKRLQPKLFIDSFPIVPKLLPSSRKIFQSALLFTSGSTGVPKIAVLPLKALLANALHSVPLNPTDRWLLSLPLFHVGGIGILLRCALFGASIALEKTDPEITHLSCVPTQLYRESPVYKKLKMVLLGGAPIKSYPDYLPISLTYGLTEMGSMVLAKEKPPLSQERYYLGRALPNREMRLAKGGEIEVRGKTLFAGYLDDISDPFSDGWFATGDVGSFDPEKGFAILGRKDLQFISGGENIQPEEIEQCLLQIPDVLEAIVIPKPDAEFGMRPFALLKAVNPTFTYEKMKEFLMQVLPKYKIPIAMELVDEFPKTGFKIDRKAVLRSFAGSE